VGKRMVKSYIIHIKKRMSFRNGSMEWAKKSITLL